MWGTLAFEDYESNEAQLAVKRPGLAPQRCSAPREGPALLQGLIICGKCGERMTVRSHQRAGEPHRARFSLRAASAFNGERLPVNAFLVPAWIGPWESFW
jgi:hypothetical protein